MGTDNSIAMPGPAPMPFESSSHEWKFRPGAEIEGNTGQRRQQRSGAGPLPVEDVDPVARHQHVDDGRHREAHDHPGPVLHDLAPKRRTTDRNGSGSGSPGRRRRDREAVRAGSPLPRRVRVWPGPCRCSPAPGCADRAVTLRSAQIAAYPTASPKATDTANLAMAQGPPSTFQVRNSTGTLKAAPEVRKANVLDVAAAPQRDRERDHAARAEGDHGSRRRGEEHRGGAAPGEEPRDRALRNVLLDPGADQDGEQEEGDDLDRGVGEHAPDREQGLG